MKETAAAAAAEHAIAVAKVSRLEKDIQEASARIANLTATLSKQTALADTTKATAGEALAKAREKELKALARLE
eukprot:4296663-Pleurochrysis_carterae.AAC.1